MENQNQIEGAAEGQPGSGDSPGPAAASQQQAKAEIPQAQIADKQQQPKEIQPLQKVPGRKKYKSRTQKHSVVISEAPEEQQSAEPVKEQDGDQIDCNVLGDVKTEEIPPGLFKSILGEANMEQLPQLVETIKEIEMPLGRRSNCSCETQSVPCDVMFRRESEMQTEVVQKQKVPFITSKEREVQTEAPLVLEKQLQDALFEVATLEAKEKGLQSELQQMKAQLKSAGNQSYALKAQIAQINQEHAAKIQADIVKIIELEHSRIKSEEQLTVARNQLSQLQTALEAKETTKQEQVASEATIRQSYDSQMRANEEKYVQSLNYITNKAAADRAGLEQQLLEAAQQNQQLYAKIASMETELQRSRAQVDILKISAAQSINRFRELITHNQALHHQAADVEEAEDSLKHSIKNDTIMTQRHSREEELEDKLEVALKTIKKQEQELLKERGLVNEMITERKQLELALKEHRKPLTPATLDEVQQIRKTLASKQQEAESASSQLQTAKEKLKTTETFLEELQIKFKILQAKYVSMSGQIVQANELKTQCQNFDSIVDDLKFTELELREAKAENKKLLGLIARLQETIHSKEVERDQAVAAQFTKMVRSQKRALVVGKK